MLEARTVAVVGASIRPDTFGHQLMVEITSGDPAVAAFPVNPRYDEVLGRRCVPSLAALDSAVDLVLLGVPNAVVEDQLRAAADLGVRQP